MKVSEVEDVTEQLLADQQDQLKQVNQDQAGFSDLQTGETLRQDQVPLISFNKPVFYDNLKQYFANCEFTDTVIVCRGGTRKIHSFVLAAASSLMKEVFTDISQKILDSELVILMPEFEVAELDKILEPIYGFFEQEQDEDSNATKYYDQIQNNPFALDFNQTSLTRKTSQAEAGLEERRETVWREQLLPPHPDQSLFTDYTEDSLPTDAACDVKSKHGEVKRKRHKPKKNKLGYLNDDFIDDDDFNSEDQDWEEPQQKKNKKRRGRPKKIKEEEPEDQYDPEEEFDDELEETVLEPATRVKEEEQERSFNQFNEFFDSAGEVGKTQKVEMPSFNQDDSGMFHCEAAGCEYSTLVRASVQQHLRQTHSGGPCLLHIHSSYFDF